MPKRDRMISRLLLPMTIFLWFIGWIIVSIGSRMDMKRKTAIIQPKQSHEKGSTFIMPVPRQKLTAQRRLNSENKLDHKSTRKMH